MAGDRRASPLRWLGFAVATATALGTFGCASEPMTMTEFERAKGLPAPQQPEPRSAQPPESSDHGDFGAPDDAGVARRRVPETRRDTKIGFGDGAAVVSTALTSLGGERSLIEVTLYDGYGIVTAHEPATGDVDRVVVRGMGAEAPTPMPSAVARDPEAARFASTDVNWQIVPALVERTPTDLGIPEGTVSHVIVEKNIPFSPDLVIRVYVTHPRGGGRIDYYAAGHPMRSFRD